MNMQEKLISRMEQIVKAVTRADDAPGLDFVVQADYTNTGHIYVQHGWRPVAEVVYSFQPTYATLTLTPVTREQQEASGVMLAKRYTGAGDLRDAMGADFPHLDYGDSARLETFTRLFSDVVRAGVAQIMAAEEVA